MGHDGDFERHGDGCAEELRELCEGKTAHDVLGFVEMLGIVEVEGRVDCTVEERGKRMCYGIAEEVGDFVEVRYGLR